MIRSLYFRTLRLSRLLPRPALISALSLFSLGSGAQAQDQAGGELEEVTVTGSRIVRRDYVSNSPIVTIESEAFEQQTGLNVESYLNQLPEYNPAASPVTTQGDVQITPVNSVGIASISLRGFGPNRSLALVDGKRPVPVNALMVTDINGVPSALIQRVETITGGASSVYGADAVGGVTNFILRKDYEGFEFDGQYGISEAGDGEESRISALFGANFADDRGNVTLGLERYERKEAMQIERDIYKDYWADPDTAGSFIFIQGTNAYSCDPNCPSNAALRGLFGGQNPSAFFAGFAPATGEMPTYVDIQFNADGTIWTAGFPFQTPLGQSKFKGTFDGLQYAHRTALDNSDAAGLRTMDGIKWNNTKAYASAPQDRYSAFASSHFDVTDTVSVFAKVNYAESKTSTILFGTNAISGWETSVPYNPTTDSPIDLMFNYDDVALMQLVAANPAAYANPGFIPTGSPGAGHPVPAQLAMLLNSRNVHTYCLYGTFACPLPFQGDFTVVTRDPALAGTPVANTGPAARWQPQWNPDTSLPPRNTYNTIQTWQVEGGVDFELPFRDWTGEVYFSHGESSTYNVAGGNLSLSRYRALTNLPDYGRGAVGTGNQTYTVVSENGVETVNSIRPAFGVGDFECTSGFYDTYFGGDQPLSEDCFNAINATLQTRTEMAQDIVEVNLQGGVYDLPAGELRSAIGFQHRNVNGKFNPDILQSEDSFTDQVVGVYPTGYLDETTTADDFYVEALIPVVADLPYMQKFEIETGARYSDYEETGDTAWTWKILGNWEAQDWLRLRGGFNKATRSPNLGELFLNKQEVFGAGGNFGDPCAIRSNSPFGAGGTSLATDPIVTNPSETAPTLAPGQTLAGANSSQLICEALMGTAGADYFYRSGLDAVAAAGGGFAWVLQEGNTALSPEKADTWTAGFVVSSPLENPWLSGITLSFDWYMVEINNAIMTRSVDYANFQCFGTIVSTPAEAAAQASTPACQNLPRDQRNGSGLTSTLIYDNLATIDTSGFDIAFNWSAQLQDLGINVPGGLGFNLQTTILNEYITKQSVASFDVETDWTGSLGPTLPGTNAGAYDYRIFGALSYNLDNWSVTMRWRHLPSVWTAGYASQMAIIENNTAVSAGTPGLLLGYTPTTEIETDSYNIFDLAANWNYNETFTFRAGITNLLDTEPENVGSTAGYTPEQYPDSASLQAVCGGAPGCINPNGRSLYTQGGFNGGYYDTLGRRFFVGLKVSY
jgi:iron complex outermembrane receptor protein